MFLVIIEEKMLIKGICFKCFILVFNRDYLDIIIDFFFFVNKKEKYLWLIIDINLLILYWLSLGMRMG